MADSTFPLPIIEPTLPLISGWFLLLFVVAAATTALVRSRLRMIDTPNSRSSHQQPTPRGGGLAIVISFVLALLLLQFLVSEQSQTLLHSAAFMGYLAAACIITAVSLFDDMHGQGFISKLMLQLLAIFIAMACGLVIPPQLLDPLPEFLSWPLTVLWLLGLTNAFNFMDGLDAMAGLTAIVVSASLAAICALQNQFAIMLLALALCAGSLGFQQHNWPPARIFMGDVGSTFLGFSFAALAIFYAHGALQMPTMTVSPALACLLMPLLLLHFLFDTIFTFIRRGLRGEHLAQAHRSHLYQLLNRSGQSHKQVSLLYAGMAALQGGLVILLVWTQQTGKLPVFGTLFGLLLLQSLFAVWVMQQARHQHLL